jgi:hypothetical protein
MTSHEETRAGAAPGTSTGHDGAEAPHKLPMRTLIAAIVGNAVEWYDWTVYATFSIYFATQIWKPSREWFPSCVRLAPLLITADEEDPDDRTVTLGFLVDALSRLCGPRLWVLNQILYALYELGEHGEETTPHHHPHSH